MILRLRVSRKHGVGPALFHGCEAGFKQRFIQCAACGQVNVREDAPERIACSLRFQRKRNGLPFIGADERKGFRFAFAFGHCDAPQHDLCGFAGGKCVWRVKFDEQRRDASDDAKRAAVMAHHVVLSRREQQARAISGHEQHERAAHGEESDST